MSRSRIRLCAQPGCTAPLAVSAPFRFCNKHRKPNQAEAQKQLTHSPTKQAAAPPPPPKKVEQEVQPTLPDAVPQDGSHRINRTKTTTQQGIDLLTRKIIKRGLNKSDDSSDTAQS